MWIPSKEEQSLEVVKVRENAGIRLRRAVFRVVRTALAGGLLYGVFIVARENIISPTSDLAYLNAEVTSVRAPIAGEMRLEPMRPGTLVREGDPLFRVENERIGNHESLAQLNAIDDIVDRLRTECAEAEVNAAKQKEIFEQYRNLFERKVTSLVAHLEQLQKLELTRTTCEQKKAQLALAGQRREAMFRLAELEKHAAVKMPFDGVVWSVHEQDGAHVNGNEKVLDVVNPRRIWVDAFLAERLSEKFQVDTAVIVKTVDGRQQWKGRVESVRAGVGRIAYENFVVSAPPRDISQRRIAVRVEIESPNPFTASQFYGIGRSVVVSLPTHD